jgi:hypothetical protein
MSIGVMALRSSRSGTAASDTRKVLTATPAYKCPAAPYEAAMLLESYCRKRKIQDRTPIDIYAAKPGPMGVAGPAVSKAVRQMVEAKGIACHPEHQITEVDPGARRLRFAGGAEASYDLSGLRSALSRPPGRRDAGLNNICRLAWALGVDAGASHPDQLGPVVCRAPRRRTPRSNTDATLPRIATWARCSVMRSGSPPGTTELTAFWLGYSASWDVVRATEGEASTALARRRCPRPGRGAPPALCGSQR